MDRAELLTFLRLVLVYFLCSRRWVLCLHWEMQMKLDIYVVVYIVEVCVFLELV